MLTGKVNQGTGTIVGFKEDSKNLVKPGYYIFNDNFLVVICLLKRKRNRKKTFLINFVMF